MKILILLILLLPSIVNAYSNGGIWTDINIKVETVVIKGTVAYTYIPFTLKQKAEYYKNQYIGEVMGNIYNTRLQANIKNGITYPPSNLPQKQVNEIIKYYDKLVTTSTVKSVDYIPLKTEEVLINIQKAGIKDISDKIIITPKEEIIKSTYTIITSTKSLLNDSGFSINELMLIIAAIGSLFMLFHKVFGLSIILSITLSILIVGAVIGIIIVIKKKIKKG